MTRDNSVDIVKTALAKGELDKLLLGTPDYQYRSKYSPSPSNTDLTELLAVIYLSLENSEKDAAREALVNALYSLSGTYEGIDPTATCILYESGKKSRGSAGLGLPIDDLAEKLRSTIRIFESRLRNDKSGGGRDYSDGLLGDLRRLSRITEKHGGPSFCG